MARPPLLLIHGIAGCSQVWDPLLPLLEGDYELVVPTLTGHRGGPPMPEVAASPLDLLTDDLEKVIDAAGHERVHVVGNSLGGWLAFELAARGRARSVLALSPGLGWEGDEVPLRVRRFFRRMNRLAPIGARRARELAKRPRLRRLALGDIVARPEAVPPDLAAVIIESAGECAMLPVMLAAGDDGQTRTELSPIEVPVRIAWSEEDRVLPRESCSAHFHLLAPQAEWVMLPGCGHVPMLDNPALVARHVTSVATERSAVAREPALAAPEPFSVEV